jgi:hypothetical protein
MPKYLLELSASPGVPHFSGKEFANDEQAIAEAGRSVADVLREELWMEHAPVSIRLKVTEFGRPVATVFAHAGVDRFY